MRSDAFRAAVEAKDWEAARELFTGDVVFRSPIVFKPYEGRDAVATLLEAVLHVFEDFRYVAELEGEDRSALIFEARVGDRKLDGLDLLSFGEDGLVSELTVMVRPLSGALALAEAMRARLAVVD